MFLTNILLAFLSLCNGRSIRSRKITVELENNNIKVVNENLGKQVNILLESRANPGSIEMKVSEGDVVTTAYKITDLQVLHKTYQATFLRIILLLAFLSLCNARYLSNKKISVELDNNNIKIVNEDRGKQLNILLESRANPGSIEMKFSQDGVVTAAYEIKDWQVNERGKKQSDVLHDIFEGYKDEFSNSHYEELLETVHKHVRKAEVDHVILEALQGLSNISTSTDEGDEFIPKHHDTYQPYPYAKGKQVYSHARIST